MHFRLLVTINKDIAPTSKDARLIVHNHLSNDDSFVSGGLFNSPVADWFVIGGRWSGELTIGGRKSKFGLTTNEIDKNSDKIQKLWEKLGNKSKAPLYDSRVKLFNVN